jgi:hypothetical protein
MSPPKDSKPVVYLPPDAQLNFESMPADPPETQYENRRVTFDKEAVKKVVKGDYGKEDRS